MDLARRIDRRALVTRHNVEIVRPDPLSPLTVGNGEFAFTADVTGLQTFPSFHRSGIPLAAQAQWGWHSAPNHDGYRLEDSLRIFSTRDGRPVSYPHTTGKTEDCSAAVRWLLENPHRLNLGRIGLALTRRSGGEADITDLIDISQTLNLWEGVLYSRFRFAGVPVTVETCVHPDRDILAVRIETGLLERGECRLAISFPYPAAGEPDGSDWDGPERHRTVARASTPDRFVFARSIESTEYLVTARSPVPLRLSETAPHHYELAADRPRIDISIGFCPGDPGEDPPDFEVVRASCRAHWERFWTTGGAVDFSGSRDARAPELERRIVLSQYLTAIQGAGSLPPQETGLTFNSWYGKFHLEMHWWHGAHFIYWNRPELLEKSLRWYSDILPVARDKARVQGYRGARWPKYVGPEGRESPSSISPFLIWQQPHLIYLAEALYRRAPSPEILERYGNLVLETAEFMASFPVWDAAGSRFVLGPPLCAAQEACIFLPGRGVETVLNPAFELVYWKFGLETAQIWRERLGLKREPDWDRVAAGLALPPQKDGLYIACETTPDNYDNPELLLDHPMVLGMYGMLPGGNVDPDTMRRTLRTVRDKWRWRDWTWGWDYPMAAMCAARLGYPRDAVDLMLMDTQANTWLANGHCFQAPNLPVYLPGNGGLLTAVAMMAAGWEGGPSGPAPGFPDDSWRVRYEALDPVL